MTTINSSKEIEHEETDYTVDELQRETILGLFYPISIIQTRYNGGYAGGQWAAFANCFRPRDKTNAFGSDTACMHFWQSGPKHTVGDLDSQKPIYYVSGDTTEEALDNLAEAIKDDLKDENVVRISDTTFGNDVGYLKNGTKFQIDENLTAQDKERKTETEGGTE